MTAERPTDDQLMAMIANNEESAFRLLVDRWEKQIHAFFWRMTGSQEDARDLAQDVFVQVHTHAGRYQANDKFKSWLFRIAGNRVRSWARRKKIVEWVRFDNFRHDRQDDTAGPGAAIEAEETRAMVRAAIAELPDRQREALILRRYHEMSQQQIAATMQATEGAVESLLVRAMQTLRTRLARTLEEES